MSLPVPAVRLKPGDIASDGSAAMSSPFPNLQRGLHKPALILRSEPFAEIRTFIEHLWRTRSDMCKIIFTDIFPRGQGDQGATQQEEEAFLDSHFDAQTVAEQGYRFLKQALYCIALHNDGEVKERALLWMKDNEEYFSDRGSANDLLKKDSTKKFFSEEDANDNDNNEELLKRIMWFIQSEEVRKRAQGWIESHAEDFDNRAKCNRMVQAKTPDQLFTKDDIKANGGIDDVLFGLMGHVQMRLAKGQAASWETDHDDYFQDDDLLRNLLNIKSAKQFFASDAIGKTDMSDHLLHFTMVCIQASIKQRLQQPKHEQPLFAPVDYVVATQPPRKLSDMISPTAAVHTQAVTAPIHDTQAASALALQQGKSFSMSTTIRYSHNEFVPNQGGAASIANRIKSGSGVQYNSPDKSGDIDTPRNRSSSFRGARSSRGRGRGGRNSFTSSIHGEYRNSFQASNNRGERWHQQQENIPPHGPHGSRATSWLGSANVPQQFPDRRIFSEGDGNAYSGSGFMNRYEGSARGMHSSTGHEGPVRRYNQPFSPEAPGFPYTSPVMSIGNKSPLPYFAGDYPIAVFNIPPGQSKQDVDAWAASLAPGFFKGSMATNDAILLCMTAPQVASDLIRGGYAQYLDGTTVVIRAPMTHQHPLAHPGFFSQRAFVPQPIFAPLQIAQEDRRPTNPFPEDEVHAATPTQPFSIRNESGQPVDRTRLGGDVRLSETDRLPVPKSSKKKTGKKAKELSLDTPQHGSGAAAPRPVIAKHEAYPLQSEPKATASEVARTAEVQGCVGSPTHGRISKEDDGVASGSKQETPKSPLLRPTSALTVSKRQSAHEFGEASIRAVSQPGPASSETGKASPPRDSEVPATEEPQKSPLHGIPAIPEPVNELAPISPEPASTTNDLSEAITVALPPPKDRNASAIGTRPHNRNITPFRTVTGQSSISTPGTEDVEDSFQTAAESPQSTRKPSKEQCLAITSDDTIKPQVSAESIPSTYAKLEHDTEPEGNSTDDRASEDAGSPIKELFGSVELKCDVAIDIDDQTVKDDPILNETGMGAQQQSMQSEATQSSMKDALKAVGPKQTESLSPYARQTQSKKKDKKSKPKAKNKGKAEFDTKSRSGSVTGTSTSGHDSATLSEPMRRTEAVAQNVSIANHDGADEPPLSPTKSVLLGVKNAFSRSLKYVAGRATAKSAKDEITSAPGDDSKIIPPQDDGSQGTCAAKSNSAAEAKLEHQDYKTQAVPESPSATSAHSHKSIETRNEQFTFRCDKVGKTFGVDGSGEQGDMEASANDERTKPIDKGKGTATTNDDHDEERPLMTYHNGIQRLPLDPVELEQIAGATESSCTLSDTSEGRSLTPVPTPRNVSGGEDHLMRPKVNRLVARKKRNRRGNKVRKPKQLEQDSDDEDDGKSVAKVRAKTFSSYELVRTEDGNHILVLKEDDGDGKPRRKKFVRKTATQRENERKEKISYNMRKLDHDEKMARFRRERKEDELEAEESRWARSERQRKGEPDPIILHLLESLGGTPLQIHQFQEIDALKHLNVGNAGSLSARSQDSVRHIESKPRRYGHSDGAGVGPCSVPYDSFVTYDSIKPLSTITVPGSAEDQDIKATAAPMPDAAASSTDSSPAACSPPSPAVDTPPSEPDDAETDYNSLAFWQRYHQNKEKWLTERAARQEAAGVRNEFGQLTMSDDAPIDQATLDRKNLTLLNDMFAAAERNHNEKLHHRYDRLMFQVDLAAAKKLADQWIVACRGKAAAEATMARNTPAARAALELAKKQKERQIVQMGEVKAKIMRAQGRKQQLAVELVGAWNKGRDEGFEEMLRSLEREGKAPGE
ncbi:Hypothetical protein D9617_12g035990 [Elsinoe fawcettii]|nr:Hypothetical protein D9617_12g035990 [Elsinoe fawcettii]